MAADVHTMILLVQYYFLISCEHSVDPFSTKFEDPGNSSISQNIACRRTL